MKRFLCILLLSVSAFVYPKEFNVPMGTQGNRIIFTINNESLTPLKDVSVSMESSPSWLTLESSPAISIDSLTPGASRDAVFSFSVDKGEAGRTGTVILSVKDRNGNSLGEREYTLVTALEDPSLTLFPSYPNPANPSATIQYSLPEAGRIRIEVYNVLGQKVCTLLDEENQAGLYDVVWLGTDNYGQMVSSGIYFIRMITEIKGKTQYKVQKLSLKK